MAVTRQRRAPWRHLNVCATMAEPRVLLNVNATRPAFGRASALHFLSFHPTSQGRAADSGIVINLYVTTAPHAGVSFHSGSPGACIARKQGGGRGGGRVSAGRCGKVGRRGAHCPLPQIGAWHQEGPCTTLPKLLQPEACVDTLLPPYKSLEPDSLKQSTSENSSVTSCKFALEGRCVLDEIATHGRGATAARTVASP